MTSPFGKPRSHSRMCHSHGWSFQSPAWQWPFGLQQETGDLVGCVAAMARAAKSKPRQSKASSSGSSPRSGGGSPDRSESSRERVGQYELAGLVKDWDDQEEIRDSLRSDHNLLRTVCVKDGAYDVQNGYVEGSVQNVVLNIKALEPVLALMGQHDRLLPNIDNLIQCIDSLYRKVKKPRSLEHSYQMGWAFRRLIQVVKGSCYKDFPPQDRVEIAQNIVLFEHEVLSTYNQISEWFDFPNVVHLDLGKQNQGAFNNCRTKTQLYMFYQSSRAGPLHAPFRIKRCSSWSPSLE